MEPAKMEPAKGVVYALSDLHLHAPVEPFLFTKEKEAIFVEVARQANAEGARLLLVGDVFDLTGMTPPARALDEFFARLGIQRPPTLAPSRVEVQLAALGREFPAFFSALRPFAAHGRFQIIAGNHDCAIASGEGRAALETVLGAAPGDLQMDRTCRVGGFFFACHGNEYDVSNLTGLGCSNRGATITSALYHAVIPALEAWGLSAVAAAVPAVRPEENVVDGLEKLLGAQRSQKLLLAFVELLRENGYFTGLLDRAMIWLATHLFPFLVTPLQVRRALADDTDLKHVTRARALAILAGDESVAPPGPVPEAVVMGHTHELDAARDYVNLGTWVDHVRGLEAHDLVAVERSLPVLVISDERATLHDCRKLNGPVRECPRLWTRPENLSRI